MKQTTIPADETVGPYRAMPIWLALPPHSGAARSALVHQTQPISPRFTINERIPTAVSRRNTNGHVGRLHAFELQPAELRPERTILLPLDPRPRISMVDSYAKSGNACGPHAHGPAAIDFNAQSGLISWSGRSASRVPTPQSAIAPQPRTPTETWRAAPMKPSNPVTGRLASIAFGSQPGAAAQIRGALRKLVVPSYFLLSQAPNGFHLAIPPAQTVTAATIQAPVPFQIWDSETNMRLPGPGFRHESQDFHSKHELSTDGARTRMPGVEPIAALAHFPLGLDTVIQAGEPWARDRDPFIKVVPEALPLPEAVVAPHPAIGFSRGLLIWTEVLNSYMRRNLCSPRLRESSRVVHALRLGPARKVADKNKISAVSL